MIVRELITRLGFDADESKVKSFDSSIKTLTKGLKVAVTTTAAVSGALFGLAKFTQGVGDEIAKTSRKLGIGTNELQAWRFAAGQAGVTTATLDSSLGSFTRRVGAAAEGTGPAAKTLEQLNIRLRDSDGRIRSVSDLLPEVADKFKGMTSEAEKANVAQNLFNVSGRQMALFLEQGSEGMALATERFEAMGGAMSEEGTASAEAMGDALDDLNVIAKSLMFRIGEQLMPVITDIALSMRDWFIENKRLITQDLKSFVEGLVSGLRIAWAVIGTGLRVINSIAQAMGGWGTVIRITTIALGVLFSAKIIGVIFQTAAAIKAAGGALLLLNAIMMKIPILLLISLIVLLIDDLYNWVRGNESVLGEILGSWDEFTDKIKYFVDSIADFTSDAWETITEGLIAEFDSAIDWVRNTFDSAIEDIRNTAISVWQKITSDLTAAFDSAIDWVRSTFDSAINWVRDAAIGVWQTITVGLSNVFTSAINWVRNAFVSLFDFILERWKAVLSPIQTLRNIKLPKFLTDRFGGGDTDTSANVASDVRSGVTGSGLNAGTRVLNNSADVNITVPPGTTDEQVTRIRAEINKSMAQQIRDAALVLEGS
ncbi:MAG: phage tail tape measure protein [Methylomicrobium sp.]|nr:phage tail tape measure protein [Methylomicrobium sp.]